MFRRFLFAVLCLAASLVTADAQSNFAVVRGSVLDPQHHPIAGAHVHLTAGGTGAQREVTANATGSTRSRDCSLALTLLVLTVRDLPTNTGDKSRGGSAGYARSAVACR